MRMTMIGIQDSNLEYKILIEKNNKKVGIIKFNLKEDKAEMLKMLHLPSLKKRVNLIKVSIQTSNKKKTIQKNRKNQTINPKNRHQIKLKNKLKNQKISMMNNINNQRGTIRMVREKSQILKKKNKNKTKNQKVKQKTGKISKPIQRIQN